MRCAAVSILLALLVCATPARGAALSLKECLDGAATANPTLRVAAYDQKIAAEGIGVARSSYLPRLDVQGGYTAQLDPQAVLINSRDVQTQQQDFAFASITLTQTIYDFGRTASRTKRATLQSDAAGLNYEVTRQDIFLQVVEAYYRILELQRLLQADEDEVRQRQDHLRQAQNLFEQGVVTRNDLLQAQVKLADSQQRQLADANRLANSWLALNFLIDRPPDFRADLVDIASGEKESFTAEHLEQALDKRSEVVALKKNIEAGSAEVTEIKAGFYPELFARVSLDYVENRYVQEQTIVGATVGVRINLFDGMATSARLRQSLSSLARNREQLRSVAAALRLELQTAQNDAEVAAARITTVQQAIRYGEENLRINRDRYQEQVGTATEVLDAQTLLSQTRAEHSRAIFDYQVAMARIRRAIGEL